jgi:hypothetical protein
MTFKAITAVSCMALMSTLLAPHARADDWNHKTVVTFSGPVEIPGVHLEGWTVLPAGTYVFRVLDSQSNRHIIQISNKDESIIYATILAIPNYRLQATNKTVVTFRERASGEPEALRAWFYPGRSWGEEFVYPKSKAIALAKASNTPVLFTPVELPVEVAEPIKSADAPVVLELKRAPVMAIQPTGEVVELAQVVTPAPANEPLSAAANSTPAQEPVQPAVAANTTAKPTLPATSSMSPLIGLLGLSILGAALAIRVFAKHLG